MASTKLFGKDLSQYEELDIDDILDQLSPEELEMLAGEVDPDLTSRVARRPATIFLLSTLSFSIQRNLAPDVH
ncbi:hypothetical protein E2C01_068046 [Portunus trituberculatus]|uniref:Tropomodulin n=1 Tax=Portunus trituberculatus TaxID=210409 RepID=A0A5B7HMP7_PORTR|nr:hypothetical protein [Portunus trituberculatus]